MEYMTSKEFALLISLVVDMLEKGETERVIELLKDAMKHKPKLSA